MATSNVCRYCKRGFASDALKRNHEASLCSSRHSDSASTLAMNDLAGMSTPRGGGGPHGLPSPTTRAHMQQLSNADNTLFELTLPSAQLKMSSPNATTSSYTEHTDLDCTMPLSARSWTRPDQRPGRLAMDSDATATGLASSSPKVEAPAADTSPMTGRRRVNPLFSDGF